MLNFFHSRLLPPSLPALLVAGAGFCPPASVAAPLGDWTLESLGNVTIRGLAYAEGTFLCVSEEGVATQESGFQSWTPRLQGPFRSFNAAAHGNGRWVVVGNRNHDNSNSATGTSSGPWSELPDLDTNLYAVAWGAGRFVAVGARQDASYGIFTMEDPSSPTPRWEERGSTLATPPDAVDLNGIAWSGNEFVAVGAGGTVLRSPDGITWEHMDSTDSYVTLVAVTWTGSRFFALGNPFMGEPQVYSSSDGVAWHNHSASLRGLYHSPVEWEARGIASGEGLLVIGGEGGRVAYSDDGAASWHPVDTGNTLETRALTYGDGQWLVSAQNSVRKSGGSRQGLPVMDDITGGGRVDSGQTVTLVGSVTSSPPATLQWGFDGSPLADGPGVSGSQTPVLTLTKLTLAQAGTYSLTATNPLGSVVKEIAVSVSLVGQGARFTPLGLPRPHTMTSGSRILPDGSIGGLTSDQAVGFRYQDSTGMVQVPGGELRDGSARAGTLVHEKFFNTGSGLIPTPTYPNSYYTGLTGVSLDGETLIGGSSLHGIIPSQIAFRWDSSRGFQTFGGAIGDRRPAFATGISHAGTRVVGHLDGYYNSGTPRRAFLWDATTGLRELPQGDKEAVGDVRRISRNGLYIVGSLSAPVVRPVRWTEQEVQVLDLPPGPDVHGEAWGVSDSGVVVGHSRPSAPVTSGSATFWTAANRPVNLQTWLAAKCSLTLPGWTLRSIADINGNGTVLTGFGTRHDGLSEAWKLELGQPLVPHFTSGNVSFAEWAAQHLTAEELSDPSLAGPTGVVNSQGLANSLAFAMGLDPHQPDLAKGPRITAAGDGSPLLAYQMSASAKDRVFAVETSPDLSPGSWQPLLPLAEDITETRNGDTIHVEVRISPGKPQLFYRLRVEIIE